MVIRLAISYGVTVLSKVIHQTLLPEFRVKV